MTKNSKKERFRLIIEIKEIRTGRLRMGIIQARRGKGEVKKRRKRSMIRESRIGGIANTDVVIKGQRVETLDTWMKRSITAEEIYVTVIKKEEDASIVRNRS